MMRNSILMAGFFAVLWFIPVSLGVEAIEWDLCNRAAEHLIAQDMEAGLYFLDGPADFAVALDKVRALERALLIALVRCDGYRGMVPSLQGYTSKELDELEDFERLLIGFTGFQRV